MAKISLVKLRQGADEAERSGRFDKAIEALKQIVQVNPRDWNTVNRIGDLYAKLNNTRAANEEYVKVAHYFADDGFYLKSIAVWKKVLRNEPTMLEGHVSLGELYQKQGLVAEARQTLGYVYDEYVKRNKLREAGEVLRRMAEVDPGDMKVRIRLAELYGREGNAEKAAGEYAGIAEELVKKGMLAEALQLLDKALRSGPRSAQILSAAARVYLVQKDYARAVKLLDEARQAAPADRDIALRLAEACLGARRGEDARAVLRHLLQRDPSDQDARQQLAHVSLVEGRYDEAFDDMQPIVDRLVERRQIERATSLLQQIVQRSPAHVRTLAKLVELYRQARSDSMVAQTYSQLVEAYLGANQLDQAAAILELLVQAEPTNEQHRSKLRWLHEQQQSAGFEMDLTRPQEAAASPTAAAADSRQPQAAARAEPPGIELTGPLTPEETEFVDEHLAEGRVFRKYGLIDKARDQFESVIQRFPDHTAALQELADLLHEKGDNEGAARHLRVLAQVLRLKGDAAAAAKVEASIAELAGGAPSADQPAASRPAAPAAGGAPRRPGERSEPPIAAPPPAERPAEPARSKSVAPETSAPPIDVEIDVDEEEQGTVGDEQVDFDDLEEVPERQPEAPQALEEEDAAPSEVAFSDFGGQFIDEDEPLAGPVGSDFDLREEPVVGGRAGAAFALEDEPPRAVVAPLQTAPPVAPPSQPLAGEPGGGVPVEVRRALEVVESYMSLGFVEDAKAALADVPVRVASHPALVRRLGELGLDTAAAPGQAAEEESFVLVEERAGPGRELDEPLQLGADFLGISEGDEEEAPSPEPGLGGLGLEEPAQAAEPDLSSELGDLFGPQPAVAEPETAVSGTDFGDSALADIFREFQKGVEKQLGKEDYETRYNLGIAYKEMGLVDEAIAEFQLAAKDEARLLECASMLGICFVEKGMPKLAVKWFEKGLASPGRSEEEYQALRYDLACALEQSGEAARALSLFTELFGQNAKFRDVAEQVRRLSGR